MTATATRLLGIAAAAAAGVLAVHAAFHMRFLLAADPGAVPIRFTCGADDHRRCPSGCTRWHRGFAVAADAHLEVWAYHSLHAGPAHRIDYDALAGGEACHRVPDDRGHLILLETVPMRPLAVPGPAASAGSPR